MDMKNASQSKPTRARLVSGGMKGHDPQPNPVEAAMARVIETALATRPLRPAKKWYSTVIAELEGTALKPPSLSKFESRFSAERKRRRALVLEASARAVTKIGSIVGDRKIEILPGMPPAGKRVFELVVTALTEWRSVSIGDAWRDYCGVSYRAGEKSIAQDAFREIVFSPLIIESVRPGIMPDWWKKKLTERTGERLPSTSNRS